MTLTGKQVRHLRGLGHALNAVLFVGKEGASEGVVAKTRVELEAHELVKGRVGDACEEKAKDVGAQLAEATGAALVQSIGHTFLLYKRRRKDPAIELPKAPPTSGAEGADPAS
jgi:RNA-binding protein